MVTRLYARFDHAKHVKSSQQLVRSRRQPNQGLAHAAEESHRFYVVVGELGEEIVQILCLFIEKSYLVV